MPKPLTRSNFVTTYALKPWSHDLSDKDRKKAWAITVISGIFSFGLFQLGCLIAKAIRKKKPLIQQINKQPQFLEA